MLHVIKNGLEGFRVPLKNTQKPVWGAIDSVLDAAFWIRILTPLSLKLCLNNGF